MEIDGLTLCRIIGSAAVVFVVVWIVSILKAQAKRTPKRLGLRKSRHFALRRGLNLAAIRNPKSLVSPQTKHPHFSSSPRQEGSRALRNRCPSRDYVVDQQHRAPFQQFAFPGPRCKCARWVFESLSAIELRLSFCVSCAPDRIRKNAILHAKSRSKPSGEPLRLVVSAAHTPKKMKRGSGNPLYAVGKFRGDFS